MKRTKKLIVTFLVIAIIVTTSVFVFYKYFYDENKLSIKEREWIDNNKGTMVTVNIPNDLNIFGYNGSGVFFDFLEDLNSVNSINVNTNATSIKTETSGLGFVISKDMTSGDLLLYQDHYVIVGKTEDVINDYKDISTQKIGAFADTVTRVTSSYEDKMTYTTYDSRDSLLDALKDGQVKYIIVPKVEYLDTIISNGYKINYHFSDLNIYYYLRLGADEVLNSIIAKFYNGWIKTNFEETYYDYTYNLYVEKLGLSQAETDTLTNKTYNYGFVPSTPYQTLASSKYGGIAVSYLNDFSKLSKVEFTFNKYKYNENLIKTFNSQKLDLVFKDTNIETSFYSIYTTFSNKYYVISPLDKNFYLRSVKEASNETIMVLENSALYKYLSTITGLNIKALSSEKALFKALKNGDIIAIDANTYDYYVNDRITGYSIRYTGYTNENFGFKYVNNTDAFYKLFNAYINSLDPAEIINDGLISYRDAAQSGSIIGAIAKYTLVLLSGGLIVAIYAFYRKNKFSLNTKIRKDDKLKFVDMLTSLKNRNYLNEKKDAWNQNTIYPQGMIVIDLNNVKYLNDTFGHEEGDKQIKATANILIKTQLDNTEIMRTDGNEFTVYLVGYNEKQVLNYIKKLLKEFKNLPYEYGAAFGFSMIVDDLKLIDDAINEASAQMRDNKENLEGKNDESFRA